MEKAVDRILAHTLARQTEWERGLDWPVVRPRLIAALETVSWALASDKPDEAVKIIDQVFKEIGRDALDAMRS